MGGCRVEQGVDTSRGGQGFVGWSWVGWLIGCAARDLAARGPSGSRLGRAGREREAFLGGGDTGGRERAGWDGDRGRLGYG